MRRAALAGGHAAHDLGAGVDHFLGMEGGLVAGEALDRITGLFVDQNAHVGSSVRLGFATPDGSGVARGAATASTAARRRRRAYRR